MNETIQAVQEGRNIGNHQCVFIHKVSKETPDVMRICELCGRIERVVMPSHVTTFEDVYNKFYQREGEK